MTILRHLVHIPAEMAADGAAGGAAVAVAGVTVGLLAVVAPGRLNENPLGAAVPAPVAGAGC